MRDEAAPGPLTPESAGWAAKVRRGFSTRPLAAVRRIAVLRANGLGDMMFALPALDALRSAYPEAEIVLLGRALHAELFGGRPAPVDRAIELPDIRGIGGPETAPPPGEALLDRLRAEEFDIAIQMHGGGRFSNAFVRQFGARLTVGLRTADALPLDRNLAYVYYQPEVPRYLELVALVGAEPVVLEPRLCVTADDLAESAQLVPPSRPFAVLHPGATDVRRRWPPDHFAAVGDALHESGLEIVITGTHAETDLIAGVRRQMRAPSVSAVDRLGLGGLAGLLSRAAVTVANDTGPLHLAAAVGSATVGIFWCGNLINGGPFFRSRHRPAISWRVKCPVCGVDCTGGADCGHRVSFVDDVSLEEVRGNALSLLD